MADPLNQAKDIMIMNDKDNVGVCLYDFKFGDTISTRKENSICEFKVNEDIQRGHKIALVDIKSGEAIIKYGDVIGKASADIPAGKHVHIHNVVD